MIKKTKMTVTQEAEKITENGKYKIIYTIIDDILTNISVTVYESKMIDVPGADGLPMKQEQFVEVGQLKVDDGYVRNVMFPYTEKTVLYFKDFDDIIKEIANIN